MSAKNIKENFRISTDVINDKVCSKKKQETVAADVSRKMCYAHEDFASDVVDAANKNDGSTDVCSGSHSSPEEESETATAESVLESTTVEESTGKRVVTRSVEVTKSLKIVTLQRTSPGKMHDKGKENSDLSNAECEAIANGQRSESVDNETANENFWMLELLRVRRILRFVAKVIEEPELPEETRSVFFNDRVTKAHVFDDTLRTWSPNELAPSRGRAEQRINRSVPVDPALRKFLCQIFEWNPDWLEEVNHVGGHPPLVNEDKLVAMLPVYRTYEEYYRTVEPLLTLELWHRISRDYEEEKRRPWRYSIATSRTEQIFSVYSENLCMNVLELHIKGDVAGPPAHGDLVILNYTEFKITSKRRHGSDFAARRAFAYVANIRNVGTRFHCTVLTKPMVNADLLRNCIDDLRPVSYIRPDMRTVPALRYLPTSPLVNIILYPRLEDYRLPAAKNLDDYPLVTKDCLNAKQLEAVVRMTDTVTQELPRICLIHGPPGTGKSRVIVNMITQIIHGEHRPRGCKKTRILMCAPSNTAVDEIVLRLMNVNRTLGDRGKLPFSLVRMGRAETMNPLVKEVSLRELARKQVELFDGSRTGERAKIAKICKEEDRLVRNANVIACTLNSCYTDQMESIFGQSAAFSVCIVDEATQSVEPDTLIPLMLGIKTMVLVGDTKQLPATVLSQKAKQLGLDQSLFARISKAFEREQDNPIIKLNTQYRMSNPIALFPNYQFYDGALKNAAKVRELPLHFYRVFNLDSTESVDRFTNYNEANFIANLMYTLIARVNYGDAILPISVGVVTPYNNQKTLLKQRISERIPCPEDQKKIDYEVNTIDSFQGQERDIMIMSCVRSNGIGFLADRQRLCVALTRAKHSLILCGNFKTFENNPTWKALLNDAKDRKVYINLPASASPNAITAYIVR